MYRTMVTEVFWEFDSIIMQNLSDILPLFCTPTCPSHHVSATQELYKINRLHVATHLVSNRSQKMSKFGLNISDTLPTFLFLPHFYVICYVLLNRHMATLNLEWNWIIWVKIHHLQQSYTGLISPRQSSSIQVHNSWAQTILYLTYESSCQN